MNFKMKRIVLNVLTLSFLAVAGAGVSHADEGNYCDHLKATASAYPALKELADAVQACDGKDLKTLSTRENTLFSIQSNLNTLLDEAGSGTPARAEVIEDYVQVRAAFWEKVNENLGG